MTEFRWVTADFAVAPQLDLADIARAAKAGFKTLIKNRPEAEEPGQIKEFEVQATALAAGLDYRALPFTGPPPPAAVAAMAELLEQAPGPVLAYCRSGMRSILAWGMAQALTGARRPNEIIALAAKAGYDLEGKREPLEALAPPV